MKKDLLATLADKNYIQQAKALFSSVYWNAGWKGDYMLLSHEIPEKELKWFRNKGILVKKCKPLMQTKIGDSKHPPVVLDKLYLFTPEFRKWKNIIYLDADIIVRANLDELANTKGFAAPEATGLNLKREFNEKDKNLFLELKKEFNLRKKPFNTGILCFNTSIIEQETFKEIWEIFKKYKKISNYAEEPAFNLFFYKKWQKLPIIYNTYPFFIKKQSQYKKLSPIIIHFVCKTKPWQRDSFFYSEWNRYLERSEIINLKDRLAGKEISKPRRIYESLRIKTIVKKDQYMGIIGIAIKKISPSLYKLIKINILK